MSHWYGSRVRNGVPLPGRNPEQVVSQLVYRVLGPLRPERVAAVLDYHGLAGNTAASPEATAQRRNMTAGALRFLTDKVRAAGAALPLPSAVVAGALRDSATGDDHLGRVRIARTLHLPVPRKPPTRATARSVPRAAAATQRRRRGVRGATLVVNCQTSGCGSTNSAPRRCSPVADSLLVGVPIAGRSMGPKHVSATDRSGGRLIPAKRRWHRRCQ